MPSRVTQEKNGIILHVLGKGVTAEAMEQSGRQIVELALARRSKGKPVLLVVDATGVERTDGATRSAALRNLEDMHYDRISIIGATVYIKTLARLMLRASGQSDRIKIFDSQLAAEKWLLSHPMA